MFKKIFLMLICCTGLYYGNVSAKESEEPRLTLQFDIDGVPGFMDKRRIENMLWLIMEIKHMHNGFYRVNAKGEPDPSRGTTVKEFIFRGKKQTLKNLLELEKQQDSFSSSEKMEFSALFATAKDYFDKVNKVLAPEAQGSHSFMYDLTVQFCRKRNRPDSLLLNWHKGNEIELYRKSVTSFKIFHIFSTDLMNFLGDIIKSCPKAFSAYKKSIKPNATPQLS